MIYVLMALAAVLAAATVWFLLRPLARSANADSSEEYYQLQLVRDRLIAQLNEIDVDERDRAMESDTASDERARLEGELAGTLKKIDTLASQEPAKEKRSRSRSTWKWTVVVLAVAVPVFAVGVYLINASVVPTQLDVIASLPAGVPPQVLKMVARLEKRLQENPDDVDGWLRLGRSYAVLGRLQDAKMAYDRAYQMLPKNYEAPDAEAAWFLGLAAFHNGDTPRALQFWDMLLKSMPPDSEAAKQLKRVIDDVRSRKNKKP